MWTVAVLFVFGIVLVGFVLLSRYLRVVRRLKRVNQIILRINTKNSYSNHFEKKSGMNGSSGEQKPPPDYYTPR